MFIHSTARYIFGDNVWINEKEKLERVKEAIYNIIQLSSMLLTVFIAYNLLNFALGLFYIIR